jgi:hypothetical protein
VLGHVLRPAPSAAARRRPPPGCTRFAATARWPASAASSPLRCGCFPRHAPSPRTDSPRSKPQRVGANPGSSTEDARGPYLHRLPPALSRRMDLGFAGTVR